mmetsp:Transcript_260/g.712  ORF Transcript_260/g.712 Transcript_260/m.712 type:complete len:268 (+) Transcript_260:1729-2532(+)
MARRRRASMGVRRWRRGARTPSTLHTTDLRPTTTRAAAAGKKRARTAPSSPFTLTSVSPLRTPRSAAAPATDATTQASSPSEAVFAASSRPMGPSSNVQAMRVGSRSSLFTGFSKNDVRSSTTTSPRRARRSRRTRRCAAKSDVRRWEALSSVRRRSSSTDWRRFCRALPFISKVSALRRSLLVFIASVSPTAFCQARLAALALRSRAVRSSSSVGAAFDADGARSAAKARLLSDVSRRSKAQPSAWKSSVESHLFLSGWNRRALFL